MSGIYIHIPFCESKCNYCDFFARVVNNLETRQAYVDALCKEIELQKNYLKTKTIQTIYFGGGTPSVLSINQLQQIFKTIFKIFDLEKQHEITLEANPENLTKEYLEKLKDNTPVNRLSIGIQSFFDDDLLFMNRKHTAREAIDAVRNARRTGYENITVDLIYSLPNMTSQRLLGNLKQFFELGISHLSAYNLIIEEATVLGLWKKKGKIKELEDEQSLSLYKLLIEQMEAHGYEHYEISNFAKPNFLSVHNFSYWTGEKYLGIGAGAHSFDKKSRQWNIANIKKYIETIQKGEIPAEKETLSNEEKFNEFIMTGLRTYLGISEQRLSEEFREFYAQIRPQINNYLSNNFLYEKNGNFILTKEGKFISDAIMSDLMIID